MWSVSCALSSAFFAARGSGRPQAGFIDASEKHPAGEKDPLCDLRSLLRAPQADLRRASSASVQSIPPALYWLDNKICLLGVSFVIPVRLPVAQVF